MDFFVVPTVTVRVVYAWFAIDHRRRRSQHFDVTDQPTAAWVVWLVHHSAHAPSLMRSPAAAKPQYASAPATWKFTERAGAADSGSQSRFDADRESLICYLVRTSSRQLLDVLSSTELARAIRERVETLDGARVIDLHLWHLGPGRHGCILSIVSSIPRPLDEYRAAVYAVAAVGHLTIEIASG
jgi:hypothetical protein